MPELPEVETVRAGLAPRINGRSVVEVVGSGLRMFRKNPGGLDEVKRALLGTVLRGVERRGKFLWLPLGGQTPNLGEPSFVVHLGMSGQIHWQSASSAASGRVRHEHLWLRLSDGSALSFVDQRTFGHLTVSPLTLRGTRSVPELMKHIAPDPFEAEFSAENVIHRGSCSARPVKTLLLDQELISGVGSIYADEALFVAGVHGARRGREISAEDWEAILAGTQTVMGEALKVGGTSFDALYVDVDGNPGYFARSLAVYGKSGTACSRCGTTIERLVVGGRSTHFCPTCQTP